MRVTRLAAVCLVVVAMTVAVAQSPARADAGDPIGAFDTISARLGSYTLDARNPGSPWEIFGWAADADAPGQPLDVHLYVDGQPAQAIHTGDPRPDVDAAFPFAGPNAGWHAFVGTGPPFGAADGETHTVCAYAINVGPGSNNTTLGCHTFPIPGTSIADPQGSVDAITITPGLVRFQGWTGDGDAPGVTPVRPVIDGVAFDSLLPTYPREDARAAFPGLRNASGFDATLPMLPGSHSVCLYAGNDGPNGFNNTSLGCGQIDVPDVQPPAPGDPHGAFDAITFDRTTVLFNGWAWDPQTSGPYRVRVRVLEHRFDYFSRGVVVDGSTGDPRPDVQQAYPSAPGDTGYRVALDNDGSVPATLDYACVYVLQGPTERLLGCKPFG